MRPCVCAKGRAISSLALMVLAFALTGYAERTTASELRWSEGKVFLRDGRTVGGGNLEFGSDSAYLTVAGSRQSFALADVTMIQAKRGTAGTWALGCGGGCLGLCGLSFVAAGGQLNGEPINVGQYVLGSCLWTGIFAGIGYLIGALTDSWQMVYVAPVK